MLLVEAGEHSKQGVRSNPSWYQRSYLLNLSELRSCRSVGLDEIVMAVESLWHKVIS